MFLFSCDVIGQSNPCNQTHIHKPFCVHCNQKTTYDLGSLITPSYVGHTVSLKYCRCNESFFKFLFESVFFFRVKNRCCHIVESCSFYLTVWNSLTAVTDEILGKYSALILMVFFFFWDLHLGKLSQIEIINCNLKSTLSCSSSAVAIQTKCLFVA